MVSRKIVEYYNNRNMTIGRNIQIVGIDVDIYKLYI